MLCWYYRGLHGLLHGLLAGASCQKAESKTGHESVLQNTLQVNVGSCGFQRDSWHLIRGWMMGRMFAVEFLTILEPGNTGSSPACSIDIQRENFVSAKQKSANRQWGLAWINLGLCWTHTHVLLSS
jgi:hypothetical protein